MTDSEIPAPDNTGQLVLLGSPGPFSLSVFRTLRSKGVSVSHVVCTGVAPAASVEDSLPVSPPDQDETLATLASRFHIPLTYVSDPSDLASPRLALPENPDFLLVACFPFRIPAGLIQRARIACLNIHPSLLPEYRGPDPIFWQLQKGETRTGVSLHIITQRYDAGPVIMQKVVSFGEGAYKQEIETRLGEAGASLVSSLILQGLSIDTLARNQEESESSYFHFPTGSDYQLFSTWTARQAFNFIRGSWPPIKPFTLITDENTWIITQALDYTDKQQQTEPVQKHENELYIQFSTGILHALGHEA